MKIASVSFTNSPVQQRVESKSDTGLDRFYTKIRNSADMNDTILVPRTIFKGYLGIMTGTIFTTLSALSSAKPKLSKLLGVGGALTSMYGTWAFVRPYILKDTPGVMHKK